MHVGTTTATQSYCTQELCELVPKNRGAAENHIANTFIPTMQIPMEKDKGKWHSCIELHYSPTSCILHSYWWGIDTWKNAWCYWYFWAWRYLSRACWGGVFQVALTLAHCPFFIVHGPIFNLLVKEVMLLLFAIISQKWGTLENINPILETLSESLTGMVWHSSCILEYIRIYPGHLLTALPLLLDNADLLH